MADGNKGASMAPMVKRVAVIGITGAAAKVATDQLVDGWFVDGNNRDTSENAPYYRAASQLGIGIAAGFALRKRAPSIAAGLAAGCAVGAMVRVLDKAEFSKSIRDLVDGDRDGSPRAPLPFVRSTTQNLTSGAEKSASGIYTDRRALRSVPA